MSKKKYKRLSNRLDYDDEQVQETYGSEYLYDYSIWLECIAQGVSPEKMAKRHCEYFRNEYPDITMEEVYDKFAYQDRPNLNYVFEDIEKMDNATRKKAMKLLEDIRHKDFKYMHRYKIALIIEFDASDPK